MLLVTWMQFCKLSRTLLSINIKPISLADFFCFVAFIRKDDVWVGHLLSGYSLPMEEPKPGEKHIGGSWRQSIQAAFEATKASFPGGEIVAHLDHK